MSGFAKLMGNIKKSVDHEEIKETHIAVESEVTVLEIENSSFDYSVIDENTRNFLKEKELQLHQAGNRFYTEMGKILTEANATLSQNGYGCFIQWSESIGIKKHTSYNLINRYKMIVENFDKREIIENIPLSLSYEISKEKVDIELKEKVLSGEIRDRKTFIEKAKEKTPVKNTADEKIEKPQNYFIEPIKNDWVEIKFKKVPDEKKWIVDELKKLINQF